MSFVSGFKGKLNALFCFIMKRLKRHPYIARKRKNLLKKIAYKYNTVIQEKKMR